MPATSFSNLITFSRGTGATVTDSTGRLTYAPNKLFTFSEQFDNAAWTKFSTTATANATTAPDGTLTADRILETTATSTHLVAANAMVSVVTGQSYTISVYAKQSGRNWFRITSNFSGGSYASFDIANGVLGTVSGGTATITDAGNGWWRCSLTVVATLTGTASPDFRLATSNTAISYAGNASLGVFFWGAQMEQVTYQTTPSTYYPTTVKNLLGFSQDFSNAAWTKSATSIVGCPYVNPVDGLFTAQKLMEDATSAVHTISGGGPVNISANTKYTISIYAKAAGRNWLRLLFSNATAWGGTSQNAYFDLANGAVGTVSGGGAASITPVGNGWYRCALVSAVTTTTGSVNENINLATADNGTSYTGDGNSGIYIFGAQLSDSGSLDPYVPTPAAAPSSTAYYGPRLDYDPITLAPKGLLVEEARTNLLTYSQQLDNAAWTNLAATVTPNSAVAPDGTNTADKAIATVTGTSTTRGVYGSATLSATAYAVSVYAKSAEYSLFRIAEAQGGRFAVSFDLSNGTVISGTSGGTQFVSASISSVGNGWYRCTVIFNGTAVLYSPSFIGYPAGASLGNFGAAYLGDGTSGIYVYGAQLEAGAFATSYIPTVASTVTRSADVATITGSLFSGWYRQDEGTFLVRASTIAPSGVITQVGQSSANSYAMRFNAGSAAINAAMVIYDASTITASIGNGQTNTVLKYGAAYRLNDAALSINGASVLTDTSTGVPQPDRMAIGMRSSDLFLNGHIQTIQYIPNRNSDAQLQTLSTG